MTIWEHDAAENPVTALAPEECWDLLRRSEFGRLAYRLGEDVNIVPLNAVVDDGRLVFRTAEGSKLLGLHMSDAVAYEVDEMTAEQATSVVVRGHARVLEGAEEERADALHVTPWSTAWKGTFVAIDVTEITGRRFRRV